MSWSWAGLSGGHVTPRRRAGNESATGFSRWNRPERAKLPALFARCANMAFMATWKLLTLAYKARRGWSRIPPAQRRMLLENAGKQARKHGPVIAKQVATAVSEARKRRA